MKKLLKKNSIILNTLAIALSFGVMACGTTEIYSKDNSEELNDEKFDSRKDQKDAQFLVNAAEIYMEEIGLAKLAQQKGTTSPIKELGRTVELNHQNSLDELTKLAKRKEVTIPNTITDQGDESYRLLNEKTGDEFDETYANLMVEKHEAAIAIFEKAADKSKDNQIQSWANDMLVVLRTCLAEAKLCAAEFERE